MYRSKKPLSSAHPNKRLSSNQNLGIPIKLLVPTPEIRHCFENSAVAFYSPLLVGLPKPPPALLTGSPNPFFIGLPSPSFATPPAVVPSKLCLLFDAKNLFRSGVAPMPILIAKMLLPNCFGGQVFCTKGVASLMGERFSLSSSWIVPVPTDGGGPGVALAR